MGQECWQGSARQFCRASLSFLMAWWSQGSQNSSTVRASNRHKSGSCISLKVHLEEEMGKVTLTVFCWSKAITGVSLRSSGGEVDPTTLHRKRGKAYELNPSVATSLYITVLHDPSRVHCSGTWSAFGDCFGIQTSATGVGEEISGVRHLDKGHSGHREWVCLSRGVPNILSKGSWYAFLSPVMDQICARYTRVGGLSLRGK